MDKMTDARAVEVLAAMREDGGAVADADYVAAIDRAVARLREPAGVGGEWVLVPREPTEAMIEAGNAAAHAGGCDLWQLKREVMNAWPAMLASAPQPPAEAQAQGGGEVVAERHALYGIRWIKQLRDMKPGTQWFIEGRAEPIATVTSSAGVLWHMAESEIPHGTKYRTAPPSAPVVDGYDPNELLRAAMSLIRRGHSIANDPGDEVLVQRIADHLAAAPKPESAEAVSPVGKIAGIGGGARYQVEWLTDDIEIGASLYDTPPRPEASAAVDDARRVMHELCDCPNGRAEHAEWCAALAAQPGGSDNG